MAFSRILLKYVRVASSSHRWKTGQTPGDVLGRKHQHSLKFLVTYTQRCFSDKEINAAKLTVEHKNSTPHPQIRVGS